MATEPLDPSSFWNSISILLRNFHTVNKKIFACKITSVQKVFNGLNDVVGESSTWKTLEDLQGETSMKSEPSTEPTLIQHLENYALSEPPDFNGFVVFVNLLTKKMENNIAAVGIVDFHKHLYVCKFLSSNNFDDFSIKLSQNELHFEVLSKRLDVEVSSRWVDFVLKPKVLKWCHDAKPSTEAGGKPLLQSLQLIDVETYNNLYKEMKQKYASKALKFWTEANESTDPLKFIYEDLAIASYLMCLWRTTCTEPTGFADLGCGNGLLVYILAEEGYHGYGYDIRARKLWSLYPQHVHLIEQAIEPENMNLPKDVDWLIGNHSDELSPWLPVLAATLSHEVRYFLLPCCAYEFSGSKFQRRYSGLSGYSDFLDYVHTISDKCGYKTLMDRLKIPSTKRIALIGIERVHSRSERDNQIKSIRNFVREERSLHPHSKTDDIKLREKYETVRNCTQIDKSIIDELVLKIFMMLLKRNNSSEAVWNEGGRLSMREIVAGLSKEDLKNIKSECGGIKTLLRNKHEIFEFCGNDLIGVRRPQVRTKVSNVPQTVKKRLCFFQKNHPEGCPLTDSECTFIHT